MCDRAAMLAGRDGSAGGAAAPGSLGDLIARGERLVERAEGATAKLDGVGTLVERSREEIDQMETLGLRVERNMEIVRARLAQQQHESIAQAQEAMDQAQRTMGEVAAQAARVRGEGSVALEELRSIIQQSQDAHNTTSLALKVLNKALDQANQVKAQLEPWRGMLDGAESGKAPEAIRRMIDGVRGELTGELASIAAALRSAADRAERAERSMGGATPIGTPTQTANIVASGTGNPLVAGRVPAAAVMPEPDQMIGPRVRKPTPPSTAAD